MRQMIFVLGKQKPHLALFLILSVLSGAGFWIQDAGSPLPRWLGQAWALALLFTGALGLVGLAWKRWHFERGTMFVRGALMMQSGTAVVYAGISGMYLSFSEWMVTLAAVTAWSLTNLWEARLMKKDLNRLEEAIGEH